MKQQEKRKAELDTFMGCVQEAIQEKQEQGKHEIAKFEEKHLLVGPAPSPSPLLQVPTRQRPSPSASDDPRPHGASRLLSGQA